MVTHNGHRRPSSAGPPQGLPLSDMAPPPGVDWNWLKQVVRLWELRRLLRLNVLDVRRLLGDDTRDLTAYTTGQLRTVAVALQRTLPDPRRRGACQPVINQRLPESKDSP